MSRFHSKYMSWTNSKRFLVLNISPYRKIQINAIGKCFWNPMSDCCLKRSLHFLYLLNTKPPGAVQPFVPVQSDTAVQAKLHRDSWGHPFSGCLDPSCYWCPEGLGTEHDPPKSHPGAGYNALLHPQLTEGVQSLVFCLILHFCMYFYQAGQSWNSKIYMQNIKAYATHTADSKPIPLCPFLYGL